MTQNLIQAPTPASATTDMMIQTHQNLQQDNENLNSVNSSIQQQTLVTQESQPSEQDVMTQQQAFADNPSAATDCEKTITNSTTTQQLQQTASPHIQSQKFSHKECNAKEAQSHKLSTTVSPLAQNQIETQNPIFNNEGGASVRTLEDNLQLLEDISQSTEAISTTRSSPFLTMPLPCTTSTNNSSENTVAIVKNHRVESNIPLSRFPMQQCEEQHQEQSLNSQPQSNLNPSNSRNQSPNQLQESKANRQTYDLIKEAAGENMHSEARNKMFKDDIRSDLASSQPQQNPEDADADAEEVSFVFEYCSCTGGNNSLDSSPGAGISHDKDGPTEGERQLSLAEESKSQAHKNLLQNCAASPNLIESNGLGVNQQQEAVALNQLDDNGQQPMIPGALTQRCQTQSYSNLYDISIRRELDFTTGFSQRDKIFYQQQQDDIRSDKHNQQNNLIYQQLYRSQKIRTNQPGEDSSGQSSSNRFSSDHHKQYSHHNLHNLIEESKQGFQSYLNSRNQAISAKRSGASEAVSAKATTQMMGSAKPTLRGGMRRVSRFFNLERRSGGLSSSRRDGTNSEATSPRCCTTNSSQISMEVYQQLMFNQESNYGLQFEEQKQQRSVGRDNGKDNDNIANPGTTTGQLPTSLKKFAGGFSLFNKRKHRTKNGENSSSNFNFDNTSSLGIKSSVMSSSSSSFEMQAVICEGGQDLQQEQMILQDSNLKDKIIQEDQKESGQQAASVKGCSALMTSPVSSCNTLQKKSSLGLILKTALGEQGVDSSGVASGGGPIRDNIFSSSDNADCFNNMMMNYRGNCGCRSSCRLLILNDDKVEGIPLSSQDKEIFSNKGSSIDIVLSPPRQHSSSGGGGQQEGTYLPDQTTELACAKHHVCEAAQNDFFESGDSHSDDSEITEENLDVKQIHLRLKPAQQTSFCCQKQFQIQDQKIKSEDLISVNPQPNPLVTKDLQEGTNNDLNNLQDKDEKYPSQSISSPSNQMMLKQPLHQPFSVTIAELAPESQPQSSIQQPLQTPQVINNVIRQTNTSSMYNSGNDDEGESYSFELWPYEGAGGDMSSGGQLDAYDFCECNVQQNQSTSQQPQQQQILQCCDQCGRPSLQMLLFQQQQSMMQYQDLQPATLINNRKTVRRAKSNNNHKFTKFTEEQEKLIGNNSFEVPKHRHKRLFMLQNNYISESEGLILATNTSIALTNKANTELTTTDGQIQAKRQAGILMQLQDTAMTAFKSTTAILELKTLATNKNNSSMHNSGKHRIKRNRSSVARRRGNGQLANSSMGGWLGELSSMVLNMGQKLITSAEKCASELASEMDRAAIQQSQAVDLTYKPIDQSQIDSLYHPVAVSDLISKQQTTSIYLTRRLEDNQDIVLKIIEKEKISVSQLAVKFAKHESTIHAQMDHPNIIQAFHYAETDKNYCIYMEYAGYGSDYLNRRVLGKNKPIKDDKLKIWAQDILHGICYMHQRGVIHTDIKIDNILIMQKASSEQHQQQNQDEEEIEDCPVAKICDFGLCHVIDSINQQNATEGSNSNSRKSFMDVKVGTQDYQAPEMANETWITPAVDMWAYGIVLYEMTVGYKPKKIKHLNLPQIAEGIPYFKKNWAKKDPQLIDLIRRCLQQNPEERITSEEALLHPYFTYAESQEDV